MKAASDCYYILFLNVLDNELFRRVTAYILGHLNLCPSQM